MREKYGNISTKRAPWTMRSIARSARYGNAERKNRELFCIKEK